MVQWNAIRFAHNGPKFESWSGHVFFRHSLPFFKFKCNVWVYPTDSLGMHKIIESGIQANKRIQVCNPLVVYISGT